ncbi:MAG: hypothetical protein MJ215_06140 [Spirochaetia bacterium]|nr:hypothetical protein [Spirochaetia bacterium]
MKEKSLTTLVLQYKQGKIPYEIVYDKVAVLAYMFPHRYKRWDMEHSSDFFEFFEPKIRNSINNFTYQGLEFEKYLNKILNYHMRNFKARMAMEKHIERVCMRDKFNDSIAADEFRYVISDKKSIDVAESVNAYLGKVADDIILRKRIFYKVMCEPENIDDSLVEYLSELVGFSSLHVFSCRDRLREIVRMKREKYTRLGERRDSLYLRMLVLQERLAEEYDETVRQSMLRQIIKMQEKIEALAMKLDRYSLKVSHRDVAVVLNVPKGSVDSAIYYLNKRLKK